MLRASVAQSCPTNRMESGCLSYQTYDDDGWVLKDKSIEDSYGTK